MQTRRFVVPVGFLYSGAEGERVSQWFKRLGKGGARFFKFIYRVVTRFFFQNNGLLLSGAVAYNTLLSLIPLCALILIFASHFIDEHRLLATLSVELALLVPGQAQTLTEALSAFMIERDVIGVIGLAVLVFFGSIAFRTMENAMTVIFGKPEQSHRRHFLVSALLPFFFMAVIGIGVMMLTAMTAVINALPADSYQIPIVGKDISLDWASSALLHLFGVVGLTLLFTAFYEIMPAIRVRFHRALIGGMTATFLWEIVRYFLVWYFSNISLVNVMYGSLATVIIVLLTMEVAAVIVLLGAQVIAELERNEHAGVPWHQELQEGIRRKLAKIRDSQMMAAIPQQVVEKGSDVPAQSVPKSATKPPTEKEE